MAARLPAGLFLDGYDACVLDAALRRAVADVARRDGAVPSHLVHLADAVSRTAAEFRTNVLVEPGSGTEHDRSSSVAPVSAATRERLTVAEVARLAGVSAEFVRREARRGALKGARSGHRGGWKLDGDCVVLWLADRRDSHHKAA